MPSETKNKRMKSVPNALILAAGRGRRLMPFTRSKPKCLVNVGKYPILYYQIVALQKNGITKVVVVTGYLSQKIKKYVNREFPNMYFTFIHNIHYLSTNDIYSLYLARKELTEDMILLDSDVLFHPKILHRLLSTKRSAIALRRGIVGEEEMKILLHKNGIKVKQLSKSLDPKLCAGEFMGLSILRKNFLTHLVPALNNKIKQGGVALDRETAIETILNKKPLLAVDITEYPIIEIDFPEDLHEAENIILPQILPQYHGAPR